MTTTDTLEILRGASVPCEETKMKPTYEQIANDWRLWMEYADPSGGDTKEGFDSANTAQKIGWLIACFGPEDKQ